MSESGKVVVTKAKLDELANRINEKAGSTGPKTIAELTQTVANIPSALVTSVNGATGDVKSTFYVTVTRQGDTDTVTADKTAEEVHAAYEAGYAVYAIVNGHTRYPTILPMITGSMSPDERLFLVFVTLTGPQSFMALQYNGSAWSVSTFPLLSFDDIPTPPEYLPNPNALNIKIGDTTTSYDGSAAKTVEIPKGVSSVNGATGDVKSTFYVTVTQEENNSNSVTVDKTPEEVYAAYTAGYAVYAIVNSYNYYPAIFPMSICLKISGEVLLVFTVMTGSKSFMAVDYNGSAWSIQTGTLASSDDIPTIPEVLPNPNALNIKIGDTTTSYDGSAAKTVEIPERVPSVTTADNGKFLRVANGAWAAVEIANADGVSF